MANHKRKNKTNRSINKSEDAWSVSKIVRQYNKDKKHLKTFLEV